MDQRSALVTGASQGLGLALARRLAADGWSLVIDARREDRLAAAEAELSGLVSGDARVVAVAGDVTDPAHRAALVAALDGLGHPVRLVVNNASTLGASPLPSLTEIDPAVLREIYEVNVVAPVALVQLLADRLDEGAVIVDVSSDAALGAYEGWGGYGSSKAALDQVSNVLGAEQPSWRVLAFDPGDMRTEMHQDAFPGEDISDRPTPEPAAERLMELIGSGLPSGRYTTADAVAS